MNMLYPKIQQKKKRKKHAKSIMHSKDARTCYLCEEYGDFRKKINLQEHHVFGGPNRDKSEKYGLKVYLCPDHHLYGKNAVHKNAAVANYLKRDAQLAFEIKHEPDGHELFMKEFGKNYL